MKAGIYIHIPFCKSRCSYCDFATDVYRSSDAVERYVSALCREIEKSNFATRNAANQPTKTANLIETLYFGGGTPSLLTARQLEKIVHTLSRKFVFDSDLEFTLEMNPATVTAEKLKDFRSLGVNRASFGVQTFDERALKMLARGHDANDARNTFALLRESGFENISLDLIAGLPHQTLENWTQNLREALNLNPEHLSLYLLEIHEATPLAEQIRSRRQPLPDEDLAAEMFELMLEKVSEKGFEQYEISNFAKKGFESKHNSKYWRCEPVAAFGVSAHSFDGKIRAANERDTAKYVECVEKGVSPKVFEEEINLVSEAVFLGLRMTKGIDLNEFEARFGCRLEKDYAVEIKDLQEKCLIEFTGENLRLTSRGMLFSNEVFACFI